MNRYPKDYKTTEEERERSFIIYIVHRITRKEMIRLDNLLFYLQNVLINYVFVCSYSHTLCDSENSSHKNNENLTFIERESDVMQHIPNRK